MSCGYICLCLDALPFIHHFINQFWNATAQVCSFCEATAGSLSTAGTAVQSAKFVVVDSGEAGRSAEEPVTNLIPAA